MMDNMSLLPYPDLINVIRQKLGSDESVYLVGGAVRDILLQRETHDLDFVVRGNVRRIAKRIADHYQGAFFMLDHERNTARVICKLSDQDSLVMDFAAFRADDLKGDLIIRDFTINAIAIDLSEPDILIDPLNGAKDLLDRKLRASSPIVFEDDPLRVMRGIRLAFDLGAQIDSDSLSLMKEAVPLLDRVSSERIRDELFKILSGRTVGAAIRVLDRLGVLPHILPEVIDLQGVTQPTPHVLECWEHTLSTVDHLCNLFSVLSGAYDEEKAANLSLGSAVIKLGRFREQITGYLQHCVVPGRSRKALLQFAALFHDIAKPQAISHDENGRMHFYDHEKKGADIVSNRAKVLALSLDEEKYLRMVVRDHMRVHHLAAGDTISKRAVYRFYRSLGENGVSVCLLSLADTLATYQTQLPQDLWLKELDVVKVLMEAWWQGKDKVVEPVRLITGKDLQEKFGLSQGPIIGELLEKVREAQAVGEIEDLSQAEDYVRQILADKGVFIRRCDSE